MSKRQELAQVRAAAKAALYTRLHGRGEGAPEGAYKRHVLVCGGTGCESCNGAVIYEAVRQAVAARGLEREIKVIKTGCFGFCEKGPIVKVMPDMSFYVRVKPEDVEELVREHLVGGTPVERLLYKEEDGTIARGGEIKFYGKQQRIVLRNCGLINPEDITEYLATDGYVALERVLTEMKPEQIIEELKVSGLRGRGGAGYPTWMKWQNARQTKSERKYVVCNADEGDPGAYMDRSVLEGDPHAVLEAMAICAKAVGARQGYIYVRAEYGLAIERLRIAIEQAYAHGVLGENILDSGVTFHVAVRLGAGAFVCGEETALLESIEGHRGTPRPRPPYPSNVGLFGVPTVINNVETLANIPTIIRNGGAWFAGIGTESSRGTKVFALTGKVKNSGLIEVPMGTTLREIVYDVGGGIPNGKAIKAIQTGGPSGGVIPAAYLDTPVDYETLKQLGSMMGSGGMIVMDEDDCMVDIAKFYLGFCVDESCGKCAPCRIGGYQMLESLKKISEGRADASEVQRIRRIGLAMSKASLCGLGQTAANPVVSTLKYFEDEYREHIEAKTCRAKKCRALFAYAIVQERCKRCGLCVKKCPVEAIPGDRKNGYHIDTAKCIKCGQCMEVCPFNAISM